MNNCGDRAGKNSNMLSPDNAGQRLLQSTVELGRRVFNAAAASVFLVDDETGDLVFTALSGEGENRLLGTRFPPRTGIAGWVAEYCEPMLADDVGETQQFDTSIAETTGYIPHSIMAAPLIHGESCIGVLEILDRDTRSHEELQDVDLLALLSHQAAIGLELLTRLHSTTLTASMADIQLAAEIVERISTAPKPTAERARRLLEVVDDMLSGNG